MTISEALLAMRQAFKNASLPTADLDAEILLADIVQLERHQLCTDGVRDLSPDEIKRVKAIIERRLQREPVSRILGVREFWSLPFKLSADTLDPRPDSETVVETVLNLIDQTPVHREGQWNILDLGTGTGCLLLSILSELPHAMGHGVDKVEGAVNIANCNAKALGLMDRASFQRMNWQQQSLPEGPYHYVISNPPYIATSELATLEPEVKQYDPHEALIASCEGLEHYAFLTPLVKSSLHQGGVLVFEVGSTQAQSVADILGQHGYQGIEIIPDMAGNDRVVYGYVP